MNCLDIDPYSKHPLTSHVLLIPTVVLFQPARMVPLIHSH